MGKIWNSLIKNLTPPHTSSASLICAILCIFDRAFRIMDDDGSKSLDFQEFRKGIHDYGVDLEIDVSCT